MRSAMYQKRSILFAGNGAVKISFVACWFSPVKIDYSDYPKIFISRIDEFYFFPIKYRYSIFLRRLLWTVAIVCFTAIKLVIVLS